MKTEAKPVAHGLSRFGAIAFLAASSALWSVPADSAAQAPGALTCLVVAELFLAPGCEVAAEDTASAENPAPLWGRLDCAAAARHEHEHVLVGGDTHLTATGLPQTDTGFRRLKVLDGDNVYGERCELGRNEHRYGENGGAGTFALYREGDHDVTFLSLRLPASFPLNATAWQVVMQMKQTQPADNGGGTPVISLHASHGRWSVWQSDSAGSSSDSHAVWSTPATSGVWTRFAFDIVYSQDPSVGSIKVYVDRNGDGDAVDAGEQSPEISTYTLKRETAGGGIISEGESVPAHLRAGIYHNSTVPCAAPTGCAAEVDNVQVVDVDG